MPGEADWQSAMDAIFGRTKPDVAPLAKLIAGDEPIPIGVRDALSQMLDPSGGGYLRMRFELKIMDNKRDSTEKDFEKLTIQAEYFKLKAEGLRSDEAAERVAEKFSISEKTVYNYLKDMRELREWLKGK